LRTSNVAFKILVTDVATEGLLSTEQCKGSCCCYRTLPVSVCPACWPCVVYRLQRVLDSLGGC